MNKGWGEQTVWEGTRSPGSLLISRGEVAIHKAKRSAIEHEGDAHSSLVSCQDIEEKGPSHPLRAPSSPSKQQWEVSPNTPHPHI